jgi:glycosyltransferase involved in cell wall biosynthesis
VRIAQVSPLYESVPPRLYGGTERVVSYLTEELVNQGHDITLFASGDSRTSARLLPQCANALRLDGTCLDQLAPHFAMVEEVLDRLPEFDVVHWHIDYLPFALNHRLDYPRLSTLHGRLDTPELQSIYRWYRREPLVSISDNQRRPLPGVNWLSTVYHGLPRDLHTLREQPEDYLAFVGRMSPEKGIERAIEIAKRAELPLKIAAKVDGKDQVYFDAVLRPLLDHPLIEYIGEVGEADKGALLGGARALVFPIDWPEPFGMVMIESMAVGTPVVAWPCGSVPEIVDAGRSGYVVDSVESAVQAVRDSERLSRCTVRETFEQRFTAARMAADYLALYHDLCENADEQPRAPGAGWFAAGAAGHHSA